MVEATDMKIACKDCGPWWMEIGYQERTKDYKCICRKCGAFWFEEEYPFKEEVQVMNNPDIHTPAPETRIAEVFGFQVPTNNYYLHRGHAWAVLEETGRVRVGLDDFSQKILGPVDELKLPAVGMTYYQDHICMALVRGGQKASFLAPVDGIVAAVNPKVREKPSLIHDDPYGEGWLLEFEPINLQRNLDNLLFGETNAAWIDQESHRLLNLMETKVGATLPDGGAIVDDVYGNYPKLGWRPLVQEFFLTSLKKDWKKRS